MYIVTTVTQLRESFFRNHQYLAKRWQDGEDQDEVKKAWNAHVGQLQRSKSLHPSLARATLPPKGTPR